eukprot:4373371-Prymnesium_polylepis.1
MVADASISAPEAFTPHPPFYRAGLHKRTAQPLTQAPKSAKSSRRMESRSDGPRRPAAASGMTLALSVET